MRFLWYSRSFVGTIHWFIVDIEKAASIEDVKQIFASEEKYLEKRKEKSTFFPGKMIKIIKKIIKKNFLQPPPLGSLHGLNPPLEVLYGRRELFLCSDQIRLLVDQLGLGVSNLLQPVFVLMKCDLQLYIFYF